MGLTDQRLYRARAFEPIVGLGDVIYLIDTSSLPSSKYSTPFFVVAGIEPFFGVSTHGLLLLWNQASASVAPNGYGLTPGTTSMIPEAKTGTINAGNSVQISNPAILQGGPLQLLGYRFALRTLALTGAKEHEIELQLTSPGKQSKFGLPNAAPGFINMLDAFQDPADAIDSPAAAANQTLPAAYANVHPKDDANMREFHVWEDNGPSFTIWNNSTTNLTTGSIGIRLWGFRYDLVELDPRYLKDNVGVDRWLYGQIRRCPPTDRSIVVVSTSPYNATSGRR